MPPTLAILASPSIWALAVAVPVAFGVVAWLLRGVTTAGALAGTLCAFLIYFGLGSGGFATLVAVFTLTWLCTRFGVGKKQQLGLAQDRKGRSAGQVLANVAAASVFAALSTRNGIFAIAAVAAMAEAAGDTTQSEIGEIASSRAWLITTFRKVPPGTDGGITLPGTLAGAAGASIVASVAYATTILPWQLGLIAAFAGFLGTIVDSLLGATLERRGVLNNNGVNFLSTIAAGFIAIGTSAFNFQ
ncbi:MAG TPA: DUF92 domain-containing protein [Terriglobales bacterium]|nr:DUF92 domain-containing protein [Terriglobales bacterium]